MTARVIIAGRPKPLQVMPATQDTRLQLRTGAEILEMTGDEARSLAGALLTAAAFEERPLRRPAGVDEELLRLEP